MKRIVVLIIAAALLVVGARWLGRQGKQLQETRARAARAAREAQARADSTAAGPLLDAEASTNTAPAPVVTGRPLTPPEPESARARERAYYLSGNACPQTRASLAQLQAAQRNPDSVARSGRQPLPAEELATRIARARAFIAKNCSP